MADMTDLIRRAAKYLGWAWENIPNTRPQLHALTGLVEDKVRETGVFTIKSWQSGCQIRYVVLGEWRETDFVHDDPLIARLGALMQLVEKIDD